MTAGGRRGGWARRGGWRQAGLGGCFLLVCLPALVGCGKFFQPVSTGTGSSSGSGSGSGSSTLDSVYVVNSNPALNDVAALSLTNGVLANLPNSPSAALPTGATPSAIAINNAGTLVWLGSQLGGVYVFVVNSDGSLTLGNISNGASAPVTGNPAASMVVDPSGNYLVAVANTLSGTNGTSAPSLYVYSIDQSNGTLTPVGNPLALDAGTASQITFAPNGTQAFVALGTGGVDIVTFQPSAGSAGLVGHLNVLGDGSSDNGLSVDPQSKYLFAAETGTNGVRALSIGTNNVLTELPGSPYTVNDASGNQQLGARSVLVDKSGAYVYMTNSTNGTISAWTLNATTGALTEIAGSPFATGLSPYSLAENNGGGYLLVANAGGTPDLQAFSIASATAAVPGALATASTASTGTSTEEPATASAVATTP